VYVSVYSSERLASVYDQEMLEMFCYNRSMGRKLSAWHSSDETLHCRLVSSTPSQIVHEREEEEFEGEGGEYNDEGEDEDEAGGGYR